MKATATTPWYNHKLVILAQVVVGALLVIAFFGLSVDRGNFWYYLLTLLFLVGSLQNLGRLLRRQPKGARSE